MDEIRNYINALFSGLPKTKESATMKGNMIDHAAEQYNDLIADGKSHPEAVGMVISQLGNIEDLKAELGISSPSVEVVQESIGGIVDKEEYFQFKRTHAKVIAISVGLFILSPMGFVLIGPRGRSELAILLMFSMIAIGVGLLIYYGIQSSRYQEELGQSKNEKEPWRKDTKLDALSGILWMSAVIIYMVLGFFFSPWHPGWIVFLVAVVIQIGLEYNTKKNYRQ